MCMLYVFSVFQVFVSFSVFSYFLGVKLSGGIDKFVVSTFLVLSETEYIKMSYFKAVVLKL